MVPWEGLEPSIRFRNAILSRARIPFRHHGFAAPWYRVSPGECYASFMAIRYWFKAKRYGWGWTPATWQGWFILIAFIALTLQAFFIIDEQSHSVSDTLITFVPIALFNSLVLIAVCWFTGETPRWNWGKKE